MPDGDEEKEASVSIPKIGKITPEMASRILDADRLNIVKKAAKGQPLNGRERALMESLLAGDDAGSVTFAKTKAQAALLLKCSRPTLDRWLDWMDEKEINPIKADGRIDLMAIRQFVRARGGHEQPMAQEEMDKLNRVRAELLLIKLEHEQLTLAERKGGLLNMPELIKQTSEAFGTIRYMLLSRWDTLAVTLSGQPVPEIKKRGKASDIGILNDFSGGDWPEHVKTTVAEFLEWLEAKNKK